jgi:phage terminase large subunit-like protein
VRDDQRRFLVQNPDVFLSHYFPHRLNHRLEPFHLRLIQTATSERRGLVLYPAAHGKTTIVSTLLPIWALCEDPNIRIAIITKNDQDAKGIMQAIMAELMGNDELIADFGPFHAEDKNIPWGLNKLSVAKRTRRSKESTITAFGATARTALGYRTDWTICDDIVTDKNSPTPEQRGTLKKWFDEAAMTMNEDYDDRTTVIGTLFDPEDLYHDLIELVDPEDGVPLWHVDHFDAVTDEEAHETLWRARWPWKRLMGEKASLGTLAFNKRYRNIAVDPSRMVFREEYVKGGYVGKQKYPGCMDKDFTLGDSTFCTKIVCGFDPAVGASRTAKFCAHVVLGESEGMCPQGHQHCYWVLDLKRDQMTMRQQMDLIISQHQQYDAFASMVEVTSFQKALEQETKQRMLDLGIALRIEPHHTSRVTKPDPEAGVESMSPWFENGHVHIPWGNPESQRVMKTFVDELVMYPSGRTTDTVMAFWFAWRALKTGFRRFGPAHYVKKPMAWSPPSRSRTIKNPYYDRPKPQGENGRGGGAWEQSETGPDGGPVPAGTHR